MPLPDLIEIQPLTVPVRAEVTVPGSKSLTNRALILAAWAAGETELRGALWSEDTQVMVDCLRRLGVEVALTPDPDEPANRRMRVRGLAGRGPRGGSPEAPLELFVGNAGTAARFLAAFVAAGQGSFRLHGVPRMHERPQAELFAALRELACRVETPNERLPAVLHPSGRPGGRCTVRAEASSQFASALLLTAPAANWDVTVAGGADDTLPYVRMTRELARVFPRAGGVFQVEPDASSGSYFWALNAPGLAPASGRHEVRVAHWPASGWQPDAAFPRCLPPSGVISRKRDLADSIMTAIVLAPLGERPVRFTELGRLRVQECERVAALRTELTRCGARVREVGDTLEIEPSPLHGAEIATYGDHRVAMCFAILGLKVPGLRLQNPSCVKKTFPNFFSKLAGLARDRGIIRDAARGVALSGEDLLAG